MLRQHKQTLFVSTILILCYFFTRISLLLYLPIFVDEAEYIRYAQLASQNTSQLFVSLTVGRQPLFTWLLIPFISFIPDALLAGRLFTVSAGFLTSIVLFFLAYELFKNTRIALLTSLLYICYPAAAVYNRIVWNESLVGLFYVLSLYLAILLVKKPRLAQALLLGFSLGAGVLTKTSAFFSFYLLPVTLLFFDFHKKKKIFRLGRLFLFFGISYVLMKLMYAVQFLSPMYERIAWFNGAFTFPKKELIKLGFALGPQFLIENIKNNIVHIGSDVAIYLTPPFIVLILLSFYFLKKEKKELFLLFLYFLLPFIALVIFGRATLSSGRWAFFMTLPLLPLAAYSLSSLMDVVKEKLGSKAYAPYFLLSCFIVYPLYVISLFVFRPYDAPIPKAEKHALITCASWGIRDSIPFFSKESEKEKIFIGTRGFRYEDMLRVYIKDTTNMEIKGFLIDEFTAPKELFIYAKQMPTYYFNTTIDTDKALQTKGLKKIVEQKYPQSNCVYRLYKVES